MAGHLGGFVSRAEQDQDVPRHRRKKGRKLWKVEVRFRYWDFDWCYAARYENERDAREGFAAKQRQSTYTAVRLIDPDGNVTEARAPEPEDKGDA